MTIYLDTCALNRLTDELSQPRVRAESEAVQEILEAVESGYVRWLISDALRLELIDNPDPIKRKQLVALLQLASEHPPGNRALKDRALALEAEGLGSFDALHLAFCEYHRVDFLITTDDRFLRRASRRSQSTVPAVINPVDFTQARPYGHRNPAR